MTRRGAVARGGAEAREATNTFQYVKAPLSLRDLCVSIFGPANQLFSLRLYRRTLLVIGGDVAAGANSNPEQHQRCIPD